MADLCSLGTCTSTDWVDGLALESKVYSGENAVIVARDTITAAVILRGIVPPIEGEVEVTGNQGPFVTFHEDVKAKMRIKRDTVRVQSQSRATSGKKMNDCGFNPSAPQGNSIDEYLVVQEAFIHQEECVNQLLPTYRQAAMRRQAINSDMPGWEDPLLSLELEYAYLKKMRQDFDTHAFMGDYGSGDPLRVHTDGFIKDVVQNLGDLQNAIGQWTFSGDLTDLCIEYQIGGVSGSVAFDTDMATTLAAVITDLNDNAVKFQDVNGNSIFEDLSSTSTKITIEMAPNFDIEIVKFVITNCDGFVFCSDGSLKANSTVTDASFTYEKIQKAVMGDQPITLDYETINSTNVVAKLDAFYELLSVQKPELLADPTFHLLVSPNVKAALKIASSDSQKAYIGSCNPKEDCSLIWDSTPLVALSGGILPPSFIFGAKPSSLHVGTYLKADMAAIQTGYDRKCDQFWMKAAYNMGFKTTNRNEIIGTFTEAVPQSTFLGNFNAPQPDPFS